MLFILPYDCKSLLTIGPRALRVANRLELALLESAANRRFLKKATPKTFNKSIPSKFVSLAVRQAFGL